MNAIQIIALCYLVYDLYSNIKGYNQVPTPTSTLSEHGEGAAGVIRVIFGPVAVAFYIGMFGIYTWIFWGSLWMIMALIGHLVSTIFAMINLGDHCHSICPDSIHYDSEWID